MGWDGMGWYGDLTGWDWTGRDEMGWDVLCAPEPCRRSATPGRGLAQPGTCVPQLAPGQSFVQTPPKFRFEFSFFFTQISSKF